MAEGNKKTVKEQIKEKEQEYQNILGSLYANEDLSPADQFKLKRKLIYTSREKAKLIEESKNQK